jgi:hypothetical protein
MANTKPFVQAALLCEQVLKEGEIVSAIRIVDTFTLDLPTDLGPNVVPSIELNLIVALKSGDVKGPYEIAVVLRQPDGKVNPPKKWPVVLEGGIHGAQLTAKILIAKPKMGLYWFDILGQDELLTSVPFRLVSAQDSAPSQTSGLTSA